MGARRVLPDNEAPDFAGFVDLLKCPHCGSEGLLGVSIPGEFACNACGERFSGARGVLDFVAGRSNTALNIDVYDRQKQVDLPASRALFAHLQQLSDGALDRLGDVLEVGAGTGLLTMGMLDSCSFERAVITDISPEMLAVCRSRVLTHLKAVHDKVFFATYAAGAQVFADQSFDFCTAHSVLHHILDYRGFLAGMCKVLKPGGVAMYSEPGAPYHEAMSRAMGDSLCDLIARGQVECAAMDAVRIAGLVTDIRFRLAFPDDLAAIETLEEKHIFTRDALVDAARDAGFATATVRPCYSDRNGALGARGYVRELGISEPFGGLFLSLYDRYAERYFRQVDPTDQSTMYLCIFRR
jgi:ubiquinone/menaquinone biosynthesis C-methylase UbiE